MRKNTAALYDLLGLLASKELSDLPHFLLFMYKKTRKISFGKYAGMYFRDIPLDYLKWLTQIPNNGRRRAFPERRWAREEIQHRNKVMKNYIDFRQKINNIAKEINA